MKARLSYRADEGDKNRFEKAYVGSVREEVSAYSMKKLFNDEGIFTIRDKTLKPGFQKMSITTG